MILLLFTACDVDIVVPGIVQETGGVETDASEGGEENTPSDSAADESKKDEKPADYNNDEVTFDSGEQVVVVITSSDTNYAYSAQELATEITGVPAYTVTDDNPESKNELVVGRCDRDSSRTAYTLLEVNEQESVFEARYVIYSSGNSVALAYDEVRGYEQYIIDHVTSVFEAEFVKDGEPLNMSAGVSYVGVIDLMEYQDAADEVSKETLWKNFENAAGSEAAAVLKEKYEEIYSADGLVNWFAGLFDTELGGFYYSNSARDNEQVYYSGAYYDLLPDIESTAQALGFIESSGLLRGWSSISNALPEWMCEAIVKFVKEKQDENGYFYHPQWTKAMVDAQLSRRGRDLSNAVGILAKFGASPTYDTMTGVKGDGLLYDGTPVSKEALTLPIGASSTIMVSYILKTSSAVPSHMQDEESFRAYLAGFESPDGSKYILRDSYWIGNQLSAQASQIKGRDAQLKAAGESYTLTEILGEWLDSYCQEETGTWSQSYDSESGAWKANTIYDALNGLMKISSAYQALGLALPYPEASVKTAIETITTTDKNYTVCYAYNSWVAICNIMNNVNKHKPVLEAEKIISDIRTTLRSNAAALIAATLDKQAIFLCEDGSFSYNENSTSATSQGLPVAISGTKEGDVNATVICTVGTLEHMFSALGYPEVPILYRGDFNRMLLLIEENRASVQSE